MELTENQTSLYRIFEIRLSRKHGILTDKQKKDLKIQILREFPTDETAKIALRKFSTKMLTDKNTWEEFMNEDALMDYEERKKRMVRLKSKRKVCSCKKK